MGLVSKIALRNLYRQKRRNFLLGTAIAIGVMVLVMVGSFARGISDIMFNDVVSYVAGHVAIDFHERGGMQTQIFRDKERIEQIVKKVAPEVEEYNEAIGQMVRAIGNGRTENLIVVGIDLNAVITKEKREQYEQNFKLLQGKWDDLKKTDVENPTFLPREMAADLNVKVNDQIRIRFQNVYGQWVATKLTLVGILQPSNMFMSQVSFTNIKSVKEMMGYKSYETATVRMTVKDPQNNAKAIADKIYAALQPGIAAIYGDIKKSDSNISQKGTVLGFKSYKETIADVKKNIKLIEGNIDEALDKNGVLITKPLAEKLGVKIGDNIEVTYNNKFDAVVTTLKYKIKGIYDNAGYTGDNVIIMNEIEFYKHYYENLPEPVDKYTDAYVPKQGDKFFNAAAPEYYLLERSKTTEDLDKKMKQLAKKKWRGATVDVNSMYESASAILKVESALNNISFVAVMILFFIILIGVVNTLRMTIRERTREIGTIRSIGMQKNDVRNSFIMETFFLTLFASIAGIVIASILMVILSQFAFDTGGSPIGMLMKKGHLHFAPSVQNIVTNVAIIHLIAVMTAYFPAKRAANMKPTEAMRHYE